MHTSSQSTRVVESVQSEILDIFCDLSKFEEKSKDKAKAERKLAARRAIEQHFEKKRLEEDISDAWSDD